MGARTAWSGRKTKVFYSIAAQEDNLGDIVIRRQMLEHLTVDGSGLVIYVGPMSQDYVDAFRLGPDVELVHSKWRLLVGVLCSYLSHRVVVVLPPGPDRFGSARGNMRLVMILLAVMLARLSGGCGIQVGASYRGSGRVGSMLHKLRVKGLSLCVARDDKSIEVTGRGCLLAPDLAISAWSSRSETRRLLAVSLRADTPVNEDLLVDLKNFAIRNGWHMTFVSQVKRDDEMHRRLGAVLEVDVVSWRGSHLEQMGRVRETYSSSVAIVSSRLHALIFGANDGAYPVALVHGGVDKLPSALNHVLSPVIVDGDGSGLLGETMTRIEEHAADPRELERALARAACALDSVAKGVRAELV